MREGDAIGDEAVVGDEWERFGDALVDEVARLPVEAIMVLTERGQPRHFVQFVQTGDHLRAEATGSVGGPAEPAPVRERRLLEAVGWREPPPGDATPAWLYRLPWPATTEEYRRLTDAAVTALRDVQEVARPSDLSYRSWERGRQRRALGLPGLEPEQGYEPQEGSS
ncbi:hypothetical protein GCM10023322_28300 [Rugosimonospora acidiphila]|uniref:TY-Chap N-terminal domain-containing protein n=1 Tax=Rugosimonospora acidiphila TaxID=556531 RepID=A0ABP9RQY7_9ACTN